MIAAVARKTARCRRLHRGNRIALLALVVVALAATATTAKARPATEAVPTATQTISPAERRWFLKMADLSDTLSKALNRISQILGNPLTVQKLLLGDEDEIAKLVVPVVTLQQCPVLLTKGVGRPPTRRLLRTFRLMKSSCAHFRQAGLLFVRGFDNRDTPTITRASAEMREGSRFIVLAGASLKRIK